MALRLGGPVGVLKWGYHDVGWLTSWQIVNGTLTATVQRVDDFGVSQRPLKFEVPRPSSPWRWPLTELQIADTTLTALVGPQE